MPTDYRHLYIERENLRNDRRTHKITIPRANVENIFAHGQRLIESLGVAVSNARHQIASQTDSFMLKLNYVGSLDFGHLHKHGVQFVSQEGKQMCVVFSTEQGLAIFADHLTKFGLDDADLTYKQILEALNGIGNWTADDRSSWAVRHKGMPSTDVFKLDIELWPMATANHPDRNRLCAGFEKWLADNSIRFIDKVNQDSLLMYRVETNADQAAHLLNHQDVRMVDLPPQTGLSYQQLNVDINQIPQNIQSPREDAARVCILDSGINTNHPLLRAAVGASESYVTGQDASDDTGHGTAVAGVALYGDVESCVSGNFWRPQFWLFSGKILFLDPRTGEACFDEKTIEKTISDAVEYFVAEYRCRIFNLSIGNINSPYDGRHIRGIAYILDVLSRRHNILFVVSTGNFCGSDEPPVPENSWRDEYPDYLMHDSSVIIDPATALNVLTVGSIARHNAHVDEQRYPEINALSPASENQPSPFTRHGPSVRGAIKPELVALGGNLASPMRHANGQWHQDRRGLGVLTLNSNFVGNTLLKEASGTSFSAPYITHLAARLLNDYPQASANLLRALLVNHANIPAECVSTFTDEQRDQYAKDHNWRELPREVSGYGAIDEDILYRSTENAVVILAEDVITNESHQFYELPLPASYLRAKLATRELRVTLAHSPEVRTTRLDYVATRISYRLVKGASLEEVQRHFNNEDKEETETRNDDAAPNRTISSQVRDKGTVQSSMWRFRRRNPNEKWFIVITRQDRDWGTSICLEEEPYALVVTVTDRDNQEARLYSEIELRIQEQERARARV